MSGFKTNFGHGHPLRSSGPNGGGWLAWAAPLLLSILLGVPAPAAAHPKAAPTQPKAAPTQPKAAPTQPKAAPTQPKAAPTEQKAEAGAEALPPAQTSAAAARADPVVARVNGREIRLSHVFKEIEALSLGDQIDVRGQIERFTDSIITEEVLFQLVLRSDFAGEEPLRARIKSQVVEHLIATRVREKINVTDEDIRGYYARNRDYVRGLHVRVRQIVRSNRAECEAVRARIKAPGDFPREAAAHSLDKATAANGGEIGLLMPVIGPNSLGFEMELFKMEEGEMRIFESREGCHLVQVTEKIDPPDPSFELVRAFVLPKLQQEQEQQLLRALIQEATAAARVERVRPPSRRQ